MDLYAENILDHSKHPRRKIALTQPSVTHGEKNLSCGDRVEIQLIVVDGKIENIGWTGDGCAISQAGMSLLSEELIGKTMDEAAQISTNDVLRMIGVPVGARRMKCALLSLHTLKNTLHAYKHEPLQTWAETVSPG